MRMEVVLDSFRRAEQSLMALDPVPDIAFELTDLILRLEGNESALKRPSSTPPPLTLLEVALEATLEEQKFTQEAASSVRVVPPPDPVGEKMQEGLGARSILVEIIRRAAYDWVLYRNSRRLDQKQLAEDAYTWLFLEDEDHPNWATRTKDGKVLTAFVTICEELDLDIDKMRRCIKELTPNRVMASGRPPTGSSPSTAEVDVEVHVDIPFDVAALGDFDGFDP